MKKIMILFILGTMSLVFSADRFYPLPDEEGVMEEIPAYLEKIYNVLLELNENHSIIIEQLSFLKEAAQEAKVEIWTDNQSLLE